MTESFKQQLQELVDLAAENIDQDAYPHESFKQGCEFLMPVLMKALEQRDFTYKCWGNDDIESWRGTPEEFKNEDNKELLQLLRGDV